MMYKLHLEGDEGHDGRSELAYKIPHNDNNNNIILYGRALSSERAK